MGDLDVSFRCNLVTLTEDEDCYEERTILDHSSGEISTEDAAVLMEALSKGLAKDGYHFYVGTSYRHLLIQNNGHVTELTPPHDIFDKEDRRISPGKMKCFGEMMVKSYDILKKIIRSI